MALLRSRPWAVGRGPCLAAAGWGCAATPLEACALCGSAPSIPHLFSWCFTFGVCLVVGGVRDACVRVRVCVRCVSF